MASSIQHLPGLVSIPRITTLLASLLVSLSSGTNYVYSAYAPQLGERLHITHTQLNVIGLAGNAGVYCSAPVWGRIIDFRGPRFPLASAFMLLLVGYSGIRAVYDAGVSASDPILSALSFYVLILCSFMTGVAGNAGMACSINATAKTFPDRARGITTGIVMSGFGLSAFLFSAISNLAFTGNTSSFLLLLSLGTALPMIVGFFLIRPIPLPSLELTRGPENGITHTEFRDSETTGPSSAVFLHDNDSSTHLLSSNAFPHTPSDDSTTLLPPGTTNSLALSRSPSPDGRQRSNSRQRSIGASNIPNISGMKLWMSSDFWLLFIILSLLSGTGLMYINNVGSMSQALFAKGNPSYDEGEASRWQAAQVSSISIMNFSGRIIIGLISDFAKNKLQFPRSYCLVLVSIFFLTSQIAAANVDSISHLWIPSALLGLAHGSVFSLFPTLCIGWFGMPHFSENWGFLSLSPIFAGYLFSIAFGRNLDAHQPPGGQTQLGTPALLASHQCLEGRECYVSALYLTIAACSLAVVLSVLAGWQDRRKIAAAALKI